MTGNIAFLCLAHNNFAYLNEVAKYYSSDGDGFFVHVDAQVPEHDFLSFDINAVLLTKTERFRTMWGSYNIIKATQALINKALQHGNYQHFILVSGVDLPLLSKKQLKASLQVDKSYLSIWQQVDKEKRHALSHEFFTRHHYEYGLTNPGLAYVTGSRFYIYPMLILNKLIACLPLSKTRFQRQHYFKGSQWWCVSQKMAQYFSDELAKKAIEEEFKYMHAPDEKVFQTLAMTSEEASKVEISSSQANLKQGIHYIDWGYQRDKVALQTFDLTQVATAKEEGCAFARKLVLNDDMSHYRQYLTTLE